MTDAKGKRFSSVMVIDTNATLADGVRVAKDHDNSTTRAISCAVYLSTRWNTAAPTAGDIVGELSVLPGDGETTESFPSGGDGTIGSNHDPAAKHHVGSFETVNPSTANEEVMAIEGVPLIPGVNRFVFKNTSAQQMANTWYLYIVPETIEHA